MGFNLQKRRISAWIACIAILFSSLAPAVSHALALAGVSHAGSGLLVSVPASVDPAHGETCYSVDSPLLHGAAAAATPTGRHGATTHPAAPPGESAFHFEHCAYCLTHAGSFALLAADATAALAVLPRQVPVPAAANQLPGGNLPWLIAHSRAPPILR